MILLQLITDLIIDRYTLIDYIKHNERANIGILLAVEKSLDIKIYIKIRRVALKWRPTFWSRRMRNFQKTISSKFSIAPECEKKNFVEELSGLNSVSIKVVFDVYCAAKNLKEELGQNDGSNLDLYEIQ